MSFQVKFTLDGVPPSWNRLLHLHWSRYHEIKDEWHLKTIVANIRRVQLLDKVKISVVCYCKNYKVRDCDNVFIKPILDALVGRVIIADTSLVVQEIKIQIRPAKGAERTVVTLFAS